MRDLSVEISFNRDVLDRVRGTLESELAAINRKKNVVESSKKMPVESVVAVQNANFTLGIIEKGTENKMAIIGMTKEQWHRTELPNWSLLRG